MADRGCHDGGLVAAAAQGRAGQAISAPLGDRASRTGRHGAGGGRVGRFFPQACRHRAGRRGESGPCRHAHWPHGPELWGGRCGPGGRRVGRAPGQPRRNRGVRSRHVPGASGAGFPAGNILVLRPGAAGLRLCDVIVATPAARDLLGSRLQRENAPAAIAGFGSGEAQTDVRAVAPAGAAAYRTALAADWAARRKAAAQLVKSPRIHTGAAARQELLTGMVDSRLLITLAALTVSYPVNVVAFGDSSPGASAGVPLREMEISGMGSPADRSAELQRIRSLVLAQHAVFLPAHVSVARLAGGGAALRIEFGAPSPLGLLLGRPVTQ